MPDMVSQVLGVPRSVQALTKFVFAFTKLFEGFKSLVAALTGLELAYT